MSACEQPLVYTTDPTDGPDELADFTRAIAAAADSPKEQRRLLAQKQLAIERLHPRSHLPARLPKPDKFLTPRRRGLAGNTQKETTARSYPARRSCAVGNDRAEDHLVRGTISNAEN